jgi:MFS transporter, FHS family, L-fucose permease
LHGWELVSGMGAAESKMAMKLKALPVFLAFLAMGFSDALGPFVSLAKREFHLTTASASMIPLAGLSMYGLLSIPAGVLQSRRGKKFVLLLGLLVTLAGLLNASFGLTTFMRFLLTVVLIGAGAAILQVAGNPIMRDVSATGKFPRNVVLGQFVKAIGSLSGPIIPVVAARYFGASWQVIFPIYSVALLVTILAAATLHLRDKRDESGPRAATLRSCLALLGNRYVLTMTLALFFYVGAEVSVSAGIPLYLKEQFNVDIARVGLLGTGLFFTALITGRFCGGVILNWIAPSRFLILSCIVSLTGLAGLFAPEKGVAICGFVLAGLGFANIFPLVFSAALERMPERASEISGLMVTAIVGGALLPPLMGLVADQSTVRIGFLVPIAAIVYVGAAALLNRYSNESVEMPVLN